MNKQGNPILQRYRALRSQARQSYDGIKLEDLLDNLEYRMRIQLKHAWLKGHLSAMHDWQQTKKDRIVPIIKDGKDMPVWINRKARRAR